MLAEPRYEALDFCIYDDKPSDALSVNSDKVFRLFNTQLKCTRPFQRKQEITSNPKKKEVLEMGKLIKNTSFGSRDSGKGAALPLIDLKRDAKSTK
jgi:hypothetical protein